MKLATVLAALSILSLLVAAPELRAAAPAQTVATLPGAYRGQTPLPARHLAAADGPPPPTGSTTYLPLIAQGHRGAPRCSPDSKNPFGVQIAALHQISADGQMAPSRANTLEAQWSARLEDEFPSLVDRLAQSGACWVRLRIDWASIQPEPSPAGYQWGTALDERLRLISATGVQVIAHIDGVPEWAGDAPFGPIEADRLDEFGQFVSELVLRYQQQPYGIRHWELFNEPDLTEPRGTQYGWGLHGERYAAMLAVAYPAIKAADPQATVLMGGLAHDWFTEYDGPYYRYFPDETVTAGGADHFDIANLHYFPDFRREWERWDPNSEDRRNGWLPAPTCGNVFDGQGLPYEAGGVDLIAKVTHYRNRLRACFDVERPIWITELGEHGFPYDAENPEDPLWSLKQQARYVVQGNVRGLAAGVERIIWFALVSPPYDPHEQGLLYGEDWTPKPAFFAYQTLVSELAGYKYDYPLDSPGVEGYVFRASDGHEKVVAWWAWEWPQSGSQVFAPATRLRIVDYQGKVWTIYDGDSRDLDGSGDGKIQLQMTADPIFVSW